MYIWQDAGKFFVSNYRLADPSGHAVKGEGLQLPTC
jgi:hypothetical protein